MFIDYRAGVDALEPLEDYGRKELGLGFKLARGWEIAAGLDNEVWYATGGPGELFKYKGLYIRAGYRFR